MTLTRDALRELAVVAIGSRHCGADVAIPALHELQRHVRPELLIALLDEGEEALARAQRAERALRLARDHWREVIGEGYAGTTLAVILESGDP